MKWLFLAWLAVAVWVRRKIPSWTSACQHQPGESIRGDGRRYCVKCFDLVKEPE